MSKNIERSKFYGGDEKRYWNGIGEDNEIKLLAKMFREITHMKPPRGRTGRHLPYEGHYAVETPTRGVFYQDVYTVEQEMGALENKGRARNAYRPDYPQGAESNEKDLERLAKWHKQHQSLLAVKNATNGLQDLVQGLMGLGLQNVEYTTTGRREEHYQATMTMNNFVITIVEKGVDT